MVDPQRIIENIRSLLSSMSASDAGAVAAAAKEYADACDQANDRLRKCSEMLRQGLRSEAIQQCEVEPNLLDLVGVLDFAELPEWIAVVQTQQLDLPPALLLDGAGDLNEAYSQEQPLAIELRKHRLMAIGRAPLRERLKTVRRLAQLDAGNGLWLDDVRTYERARLDELRREAKEAFKQGNVAVLEQAATDIGGDTWTEPPPSGLIREVTEAYGRLVRRQARVDLEHIDPELNKAFARLDDKTGLALASRWRACAALCGLDSTDPLAERAAPALEWIAELERKSDEDGAFRSALAELEQALDNEHSTQSTLERLAHAVARFERELPAALEQRVRSRLGGFELSRSRRLRLIVAGIAAAVVAAIVVVSFFVWRYQRNEQIAIHVTAVRSLIEQDEWDKADDRLKELQQHSPGVYASSRIQQLVVEVVELLDAEAERKAEFDEAIRKVAEGGEANPDREALDRATQKVRTRAEKAAVGEWSDRIAKVENQQQQARDVSALKELDSLRASLAQLESDSAIELRAKERELLNLQQELKGWETKFGRLSQSTLAQAKPVESRIAGRLEAVRLDIALRESTPRITRAATLERFADELKQFGGEPRFAATERARNFAEALAEKPLWDEIQVWNRELREWSPTNVAKLDAAEARKPQAAWKRLIDEHGGHPAAAALEKKLPALQAVIARVDDEDERIYARFRSLLGKNPAFSWYLVVHTEPATGEKRKYYTADRYRPTGNDRPVLIKYFNDVEVAGSGNAARQDVAEKNIRGNEFTCDESPQRKLAGRILRQLNDIHGANWESTSKVIIMGILNEPELDAILRVKLLTDALEFACKGSAAINQRFREVRTKLIAARIDGGVRWMAPVDDTASSMRRDALAVLAGLTGWESLWTAVEEDHQEFLRAPEEPSEWIGWLYVEQQSWRCALKDGTNHSGPLYVAIRSGGEKQFQWAEVGSIANGIVKLNPTSDALLEGRPVFVRKSQS